jgi:hypothetical protein
MFSEKVEMLEMQAFQFLHIRQNDANSGKTRQGIGRFDNSSACP